MSEEYALCWVHQDCHVADEQKAALKKVAGVSGGKDECQVRLKGREHDYWMDTGINRVYRLYSEGWRTGKELLNGLQTVDKRRNNQRPSEQYAQPVLESKIYVARRTRIEAPARSTILRRVGLPEALSSAARSSLILFVVDF